MSRRYRIKKGRGKGQQYAVRDRRGRFKDIVNIGKSIRADSRQTAMSYKGPGYGHLGDAAAAEPHPKAHKAPHKAPHQHKALHRGWAHSPEAERRAHPHRRWGTYRDPEPAGHMRPVGYREAAEGARRYYTESRSPRTLPRRSVRPYQREALVQEFPVREMEEEHDPDCLCTICTGVVSTAKRAWMA